MINAGRVLIIPKGEWTNLESYEMLDLVTRGDVAYIARQASVGVDPATDTQLTYWQPFGTAAKIATTTTPGLVMPDGTTITIDATGLIKANIGISDIKDVVLTSVSDGQIIQYNSTTQKWENKSLGTAASRNATSAITSGSTDLIESGAVNLLKQTLETQISGKLGSSDIANNLTTTTTGKVLDATQGKALNDSKAPKSDLTSINVNGTNTSGEIIYKGTYFYNNGTLKCATSNIAINSSITNSNSETVTVGALNKLSVKLIATSGTGNWGAQLNSLASSVGSLTSEQKMRSYVVREDNYKFVYSADNTYSRIVVIESSGYIQIESMYIKSSGSVFRRYAIDTSGTVVSYDISTTSTVANTFKLYA